MDNNVLSGIGDRPISHEGEEKLEISKYAHALTDFVRSCDTPLTIGLQGDWGSGKTSLMNLIRKSLDDEGDKSIRTVIIDTWMYSQLGDEETLFLEVLGGVVDGMAAERSAKEAVVATVTDVKGLKKKLWWALQTATAVTRGTTLPETSAEGEYAFKYKIALDLKLGLQKLVDAAAGENGRVILFVDDLDRVPPERAVQILEALKNFLDVPKLVTVLACDYGVISRGLSARMGVTEEELGRSFFDKIIQVPFRMPVHNYDATGYITALLQKVDVKADEAEVALAAAAIRHSIGLNPRAMKRHANTLLLLVNVATRTENLGAKIREGRRPLVMLALTLMQATYPAAHRYLARLLASGESDTNEQVRAFLMGRVLPNADVEPWVEQWLVRGDDEAEHVAGGRFGMFLDALKKLTDVDGNDELEDSEIELLREMVSLSRVSSVETGEEERTRRSPLGASAFVLAVGEAMTFLKAREGWDVAAKGSLTAPYRPFGALVTGTLDSHGRVKASIEFWMSRPEKERATLMLILDTRVSPRKGGATPPAWVEALHCRMVESLRFFLSDQLPQAARFGRLGSRTVVRLPLDVTGVRQLEDDDASAVQDNLDSVQAAGEYARIVADHVERWTAQVLPGPSSAVSRHTRA